MQRSNNNSSHDLPEAVAPAGASTYKYSVPDHAAQDSSKEVAPQTFAPHGIAKRQRWTRWPLLLLYGLLIALLAGVAGGFIGKALSKAPHNTTSAPSTATVPPNNSSSNSSSDSAARILPIPSTGCPRDIHAQKYMANTSLTWGVPYTTVCATRWTDPQLSALSAATASDCIEACHSFNGAKAPDANAERCLGASFVPGWWDQARAMAQKNEPFNCFLMKEQDLRRRNDRDFEIVALCLGESCTGLLGG